VALAAHVSLPTAAGSHAAPTAHLMNMAAMIHNQPDVVRALLEAGAAVDPRLGVEEPDDEPASGLMDEDVVGATPLYLAARNGRLEVVRALLAAGANPQTAATPPAGAEVPIMDAVCTSTAQDTSPWPADKRPETARAIRSALAAAQAARVAGVS
jgi:hypothetical protein